MRFRELVLHDVGVYAGRQAIDLQTDREHPIVLIGGLNGCGKTTLLDSMQLVLYGNRARLSGREGRSYDEYLRDSIHWNANPRQGASITLTFDVAQEGYDRTYRVTRAWRSTGKGVKESLDVLIDGEVARSESLRWPEHIEQILPLEIASLFFFDAEKIESLADPETAGNVIRTAINSLLGVSTMQQLRADLNQLERRQGAVVGHPKLDQRIADYTEELDRIQRDLDGLVQRRAECVAGRREGERELAKVEAEFESQGGSLYERRVELELRLAQAESTITDVRSELRQLAEGSLPLALLAEQIAEMERQSDAEDRGQRNADALTVLESRDAWLIARLPSEVRTEVATALVQDRQMRAKEAATERWLGLSFAARGRLGAMRAAVGDDRSRLRILLDRIDELQEERERLLQDLAAVPERSAISELMSRRDRIASQVAELAGAERALDEEYDQLKGMLDEAEQALAQAHSQRIEAAVQDEDIHRVVEHSRRVVATVAELERRLLDRHIGRIEVATLDSFKQIMRKEGMVADLHIDHQTFDITLTGAYGSTLDPRRLSAGERQLLAIALLWGVARVAGDRIPTIVDTPLGRLDSLHRRHLVDRYFPNAGKQVLLLSTDEEIDEGLAHRLAPSVARAYLLQHDDKHKMTEVRPGYWWPMGEADVD